MDPKPYEPYYDVLFIKQISARKEKSRISHGKIDKKRNIKEKGEQTSLLFLDPLFSIYFDALERS